MVDSNGGQAHCPNPKLKMMNAQPSRRPTIDQTDYIECQGYAQLVLHISESFVDQISDSTIDTGN